MPFIPTSLLTGKLLRLCLVITLVLSGLTLVTPAWAEWSSLTGVLPAHTSITDVLISPDSQHVVFRADIEQEGRFELYSVPVTGTLPLKLNQEVGPGGYTYGFEITPDSQRVIYTAYLGASQQADLFSVPVGGGVPVKLNGPAGTPGSVRQFKFDPVTGYVIYLSDQDLPFTWELYGVPATGGPVVKYNSPLAEGGAVTGFDIDPLSSRVVYTAKPTSGAVAELYSIPIAGGTPLKLSPPLNESIETFAITPGISYVMFIAMETGSVHFELFGNDIPGGTPRKRSKTMAEGENVVSFAINPTATQAVYTVTAGDSNGKGSLWRTSPYGGSSQLITDVADPQYGVAPNDFRFTPNGERVVYGFQKNENSLSTVESAFIAGGPLDRVTLLSAEPGSSAVIRGVSPDGQWVVLQTLPLASILGNMYSISPTGENKTALGPGYDVHITPDSQRVVYIAGHPDSDHSDVMSAQISGGDLRNLSQMGADGYVYNSIISPDSRWIVFLAQPTPGAGFELRISDGNEGPEVTPTPTGGTPTGGTPTGTPDPSATPFATPSATATTTATPPPGSTPGNAIYLNLLQK